MHRRSEVKALADKMPRHVMSYGFADEADARASDVRQEGGSMCSTAPADSARWTCA